ncbi:hypothetical protein ATY81_13560 [Rhizobium sp. R72]|uniref:DUF4381 domain-containing protein n=1 Tax=unclassified Rhizobium TaxID=2613769 RepID=UPI000B534873|nr:MULTISPECIES: DUF4381 domain-containing protein [unclassified Rhizobium]OWV82911.1 hypothetical protein ATY79_16135 [Rhizobium sp. R693]OWV93651.1 hypothetical protein ATY81_13560 [Rhizobium sp. R72]OWV93889.1 hypothetical protein ATY80_13560 [Rhizobium sp. R711]
MEPAGTSLDPMTETALRSLKDIAVPPPVSWMPQTWGWAVLAAILTLILATAFLLWLRHYRANAYRREALTLLAGVEAKIRNPETRQSGVRDLAILLKRVALAGWPRDDVASLAGAAWVKFLEVHGDRATSRALQAVLDDLEYHASEGSGANTETELIAGARNWIERHRVSA